MMGVDLIFNRVSLVYTRAFKSFPIVGVLWGRD